MTKLHAAKLMSATSWEKWNQVGFISEKAEPGGGKGIILIVIFLMIIPLFCWTVSEYIFFFFDLIWKISCYIQRFVRGTRHKNLNILLYNKNKVKKQNKRKLNDHPTNMAIFARSCTQLISEQFQLKYPFWSISAFSPS